MTDLKVTLSYLRNRNETVVLAPPEATPLTKIPHGVKTEAEFQITCGDKVDSISVSIVSSFGTMLNQTLPPSFSAKGSHTWKWDGLDSKGQYSSVELLTGVNITITAKKGKDTQAITKVLSARRAGTDWIDVEADTKANTISAKVRMNLKDGGSKGVNEYPPSSLQKLSLFTKLPKNDPKRGRHKRLRSFMDLESLAINGFNQHWNRKLGSYQVNMNAVNASQNAMDDIKLVYNTNGGWMRSSNPGSCKGVVSMFANFVPERVAYNVGWIKYTNGWFYVMPSAEDKDFAETFAHEIGHEILGAVGGDNYTYTHKGSSTLITQATKSVANGGVSYPATGEIDLMKYHNGSKPSNFHARVTAAEEDVRALLWLARVALHG